MSRTDALAHLRALSAARPPADLSDVPEVILSLIHISEPTRPY